MSMLSSKCDGLRNAADELQNVIDNAHNYTWPGIVSILHYAQQGLREAANIIWGLSCKLADTVDQQDEIERLEDENARLRSCLSDDAENARQIMAENAKLRELQAIASDMARDYDGDRRLLRELVRELYEDQCDECDRWKYRDRMRELGIEVKDA